MAVTVVYDEKVESSLRNLPAGRGRLVMTQCDKSSVTLYRAALGVSVCCPLPSKLHLHTVYDAQLA